MLSLAIVTACGPAAAASAVDADLTSMSLQQLMEMNIDSVYGASKYEQRVTQAPSSISILSSEEIRRFGYRSVAEALQSVRGLYVTNDRNYTYLGMRGFLRPGDYTTRILVLIDGHRLNDNVYDAGSVGLEAMLDIDMIDRIEVIRGPSSSVYGSSAFLGVINVVTKQGRDVQGAELTADGGSLGTYHSRATYGAKFDNGADWIATATYYSSAGDRHIYYPEYDERISSNNRAANQGFAVGLDDERATKLFTSLHFGDFTASAYYSDRDKQLPTASFETIFNDTAARTDDVHSYLELGYKHTLTDRTSMNVRAFYDYFKYDGTFPYDYPGTGDPQDRTIYRDATLAEWAGTEVQLTTKPTDAYTLVVGAEYRYNIHEDQQAYDDIEPRNYYLNQAGSSSVLGVFAQAEIKLRSDLALTAGVRHDDYRDTFGGTTNPRLSLIYNPTEASAVKAIYGQAFRAPNAYERYYFPEQSAHELGPERIRTYELVYERYFDSVYRLSLSAYSYGINGLITQLATAEGERFYENIEDARARGVELEAEAHYANGTLLRGSWTTQRSKDLATGAELSSSPRQLGKLIASLPLAASKVFASLELQYNGSSRTLEMSDSPAFVLTNFTLNTSDRWPAVELTGGVYNVFNVAHPFPGAEEHLQPILQQNGRTYGGRVAVKFK